MKSADVSSPRMLRRARDRIDRDYAAAGKLGFNWFSFTQRTA